MYEVFEYTLCVPSNNDQILDLCLINLIMLCRFVFVVFVKFNLRTVIWNSSCCVHVAVTAVFK